ncbi:glycosyltransferase family 39 protein [Flavobacterium sp. ASW18X]|uniref:ArnT family glycosyltransferase n=1 Tax=Flavobacterium sp. ASW18X TaxID=2572595 RepID=UPI0010AE98A4|nr:phospholipid carrier-dependent glycosyltransferase [Flavobacterium sp. ASW18X]TKD57506.1 phospholipid carrier-dependent glycosyltransferase [Flavobacterium sp. ASW18X]
MLLQISIVFVVSFLCCIAFSWAYPIYILDEARNAEAAREMFVNRNFVTPFFNNTLRTDKPVVHYYFMTIAYHLFGVNAFAARFFSAFFGALTFATTFYFSQKFTSIRVAVISCTVLLSTLFFIQEFHLSVPDPYLIFFTSFGLFSLYSLYITNNRKWFFLAYFSFGFGILSKGPIAIILPLLSVACYLLYSKQLSLKSISKLKPIAGFLLVVTVAVPWFYLVHVATEGQFTNRFFLDHNLNRFNTGKEGHGGLFLLTWVFVLVGLLPFSFFLIPAYHHFFKSKDRTSIVAFSAIIGVVTIVFFSVASTKLPNYTMPCYPFLVLVIAVYFDMVFRKIETYKKAIARGLLLLLIISCLLPVGGYVALYLEEGITQYRWYSLLLLVLPIGCILCLYQFKNKRFKNSFFYLAISWVVMGFFLFGIIYPKLAKETPTEKVKAVLGSSPQFVAFQRFDSAFPFNFKATFKVVSTIEELELFLDNNPNYYILTNTGDRSLLFQLNQKYQLQLKQKALFENHTTRVYKR